MALVIFSMVAMSLYAWQHVNLYAIGRAQEHARKDALVRAALAVIDQVNPMQKPEGSRPLGDYQVQWSSRALGPVRHGVTALGVPDIFDVRLYLLDVKVVDGAKDLADFQVRQAGYVQVRSMDNGP